MIAREGDQQEALQIRADQLFEAIGNGHAIRGIHGRAMGDQQA